MMKLNSAAQRNLGRKIFHLSQKGDAMTITTKRTKLSTRVGTQGKTLLKLSTSFFVANLLLVSAASATSLLAVTGATYSAHAGPCTAEIAQVQQQMAQANPEIGPSAPQSVGAQLGRQPTAQTVRNAEVQASALAQGALQRAKQADAVGDATGCAEALNTMKDLYAIQ
jgi:hypothetical protein